MFFKQGAMFGLDARIALAIFGALSVISGAALYSAIAQSKATSMLYDLREIGKAVEAYYLDTGEIPVLINARDIKLWELNENIANVANWNGPYLSYEKHATDTRSLIYKNGYRILVLYAKDDWGSYDYEGSWADLDCNISIEKCSYFVFVEGPADDVLPVYKNIKDILGEDWTDYGTGSLRYKKKSSYSFFLYRFMPAMK
jgi:type II secretory pathway pseudopilin PulG